MAKKLIVEFTKKASDSLRTRKIEHVFFEKKDDAGNVVESFVIVQNKDYNDARAVILADNNLIKKVKSTRHFQRSADSKDSFHYIPQFDCTCRNCSKTFKSPIKEAVWCSKECKKEFRNKKKSAKS